MKVRRITRGPRATFDLMPRPRRRRDHRAVRSFRDRHDPQLVNRPAITLSLLLRMMRSMKYQARFERLMKDGKRYRRIFDRRWLQHKLGLRKDIFVVPKW